MDGTSGGLRESPDSGGVQGREPYVKKAVERYDYVEDGVLKTEYVKISPKAAAYSAQKELAESIVGFCSGCKAQVQMTFPGGFDVRTLDPVLSGRAVKAICPACHKVTEFLPAHKYLPHHMVMRNQKILQERA